MNATHTEKQEVSLVNQPLEYLKIRIDNLYTYKFSITIGLSFLFSSFISVYFLGIYLQNKYSGLSKSPDIILDNINRIENFVIIGELAMYSLVGFFIFELIHNNLKNLGEVAFKAGLIYWARTFTSIITPLAQITPARTDQIFQSYFYHGMFYSGHTAMAFFIFFYEDSKGWKKFTKLLLATTVAILLIVSHSHYTLDIVGGIAAAWIVYGINLPFLKNKTVK